MMEPCFCPDPTPVKSMVVDISMANGTKKLANGASKVICWPTCLRVRMRRRLLNRELTIAYPGPTDYIRAAVESSIPMVNITWKEIHDFKEFFEQQGETVDALIVEAEIGAAWTLLHPKYTVVIPESSKLNMPLGFAVPLGQRLNGITHGLLFRCDTQI